MEIEPAIPETEPVAQMPDGPIVGPAAWYGKEMEASAAWIHTLSDDALAELDETLRTVQAHGLKIEDIGRLEFSLPTFGAVLDALRGDVLRGRGFVVIRGLPLDRYSTEEAAILYWGVGAYFGRPVPQNGKGHLLGHVIDLGRGEHDTSARIYQTSARQTYHVDTCDIVALMCLQKAKSGGLSSLVSAVTIYNEMLARRPDLVPILFRLFDADRRGEVPPGRKLYYTAPVFSWHEGELTTQMVRRYIESARRFTELPPLRAEESEALDLFEALADELAMFMDFEPGDMQFVHNHQILHDRTAFEDHPDKKRHLLRLWLCPPDGRSLPQSFADKYNGRIEIGDRGGMHIEGATLHAPLEPV